MNDTTSLPSIVTALANKNLLLRVTPYLHHSRPAKRYPMPTKSSKTMRFRRYTALNIDTAPLQEGVPPSPTALAYTDVETTLNQWGKFVPVPDLQRWTVDHSLMNETSDLLAENAGQTIDTLHRDEFAAGTVVFRGGSATLRTDLTTTTHKIDAAVIDRATRALFAANAKMFNKLVRPGSGVASFPIRETFLAITDQDVYFTLQTLPGWISVEEYASDSGVMPGEIGAFKNVRFLMTTRAKAWLDQGGTVSGDVKSTSGSNADVHSVLIFGQEAVGYVPLDGHSLENIIKPVGSAGSADPLDQIGTSAWKHTGARLITNDAFMARIEVTVGNVAP